MHPIHLCIKAAGTQGAVSVSFVNIKLPRLNYHGDSSLLPLASEGGYSDSPSPLESSPRGMSTAAAAAAAAAAAEAATAAASAACRFSTRRCFLSFLYDS